MANWVLQGLIYGRLASHLNTYCEALPQAIWIFHRFSYSYPIFIMSIRCMSSPSRLLDTYVEPFETTGHVCRVRDYQTLMPSPSRLPDTYVESYETTRHIIASVTGICISKFLQENIGSWVVPQSKRSHYSLCVFIQTPVGGPRWYLYLLMLELLVQTLGVSQENLALLGCVISILANLI